MNILKAVKDVQSKVNISQLPNPIGQLPGIGQLPSQLTQLTQGGIGAVVSTVGGIMQGGNSSKPSEPAEEELKAIKLEHEGPLPPEDIIHEVAQGTTHSKEVAPAPGHKGSPFKRVSYGPFLRYGGYDPASRRYKASALVVSYQGKKGHPPILHVRDGHDTRQLTAEHLDHFANYNFWRFDLEFELAAHERRVDYCVVHAEDPCYEHYEARWITIVLPPANATWNWGFYSCNGFHEAKHQINLKGIQPLWNDVMACHAQRPLHIMVGGGDQVYNDHVLELPIMEEWYRTHDKAQKASSPYPADMANAVKWYYLHAYMRHWSEPGFGDALSCIPQVMMWDDHDIFDGWGSYKPVLQNCQVFQGIFEAARRFFALFQQHSTVSRIQRHNQVFGEAGWHWVGCVGPDTALLVPDTRTERSRQQIIQPKSWSMIQQHLEALPQSVRHVVVVATVPIVYPAMEFVDSIMKGLSCKTIKSWLIPMLAGVGMDHHLYSKMGEATLMDDLVDHWSNREHEHEKKWLVQMMQGLAQRRGFRFTMLSGDVHVAAVSKLRSQPEVEDIRKDHRFMLQVTSSAIGNAAPPGGVATLLNQSAKDKPLLPDTYECYEKLFNNKDGQSDAKEFARTARNWCLVMPGSGGALNFQLRVEDMAEHRHSGEVYNIEAPTLDVLNGGCSATYPPIPPPPGPPAGLQESEASNYVLN